MTEETSSRGRVLLVDDEPAFRRLGGDWLARQGFHVTVAADGEEALRRFAAAPPEAVVLDLVMPPRLTVESGLELIACFAPAPVIVITAHADTELGLEAGRRGAFDFLAKPLDPDLLAFAVSRAVEAARRTRELDALRAGAPARDDYGMTGESEPVQRLREMIGRLAPTDLSVIVLGPTGTGKELVARALHEHSPGRSGPFVPIHCGAVPAELMESELFGHVKGAFTGADRDRSGLIETARGGTLFLDEIGEMPPSMQVKLLRFLQEGAFMPVGAREYRAADVRVVAATHRDLPAMVTAGTFREDLFYRLKGVVLRTPSLEERRGDIPLLAQSFVDHAGKGRRRVRLDPEAGAWLMARAWPGNVRELQSVVAGGAALAGVSGMLTADLLSLVAGDTTVLPAPIPEEGERGLDDEIAILESRMITAALRRSGGNRSEAARALKVSRVGLLKKMERLHLR